MWKAFIRFLIDLAVIVFVIVAVAFIVSVIVAIVNHGQ